MTTNTVSRYVWTEGNIGERGQGDMCTWSDRFRAGYIYLLLLLSELNKNPSWMSGGEGGSRCGEGHWFTICSLKAPYYLLLFLVLLNLLIY